MNFSIASNFKNNNISFKQVLACLEEDNDYEPNKRLELVVTKKGGSTEYSIDTTSVSMSLVPYPNVDVGIHDDVRYTVGRIHALNLLLCMCGSKSARDVPLMRFSDTIMQRELVEELCVSSGIVNVAVESMLNTMLLDRWPTEQLKKEDLSGKVNVLTRSPVFIDPDILELTVDVMVLMDVLEFLESFWSNKDDCDTMMHLMSDQIYKDSSFVPCMVRKMDELNRVLFKEFMGITFNADGSIHPSVGCKKWPDVSLFSELRNIIIHSDGLELSKMVSLYNDVRSKDVRVQIPVTDDCHTYLRTIDDNESSIVYRMAIIQRVAKLASDVLYVDSVEENSRPGTMSYLTNVVYGIGDPINGAPIGISGLGSSNKMYPYYVDGVPMSGVQVGPITYEVYVSSCSDVGYEPFKVATDFASVGIDGKERMYEAIVHSGMWAFDPHTSVVGRPNINHATYVPYGEYMTQPNGAQAKTTLREMYWILDDIKNVRREMSRFGGYSKSRTNEIYRCSTRPIHDNSMYIDSFPYSMAYDAKIHLDRTEKYEHSLVNVWRVPQNIHKVVTDDGERIAPYFTKQDIFSKCNVSMTCMGTEVVTLPDNSIMERYNVTDMDAPVGKTNWVHQSTELHTNNVCKLKPYSSKLRSPFIIGKLGNVVPSGYGRVNASLADIKQRRTDPVTLCDACASYAGIIYAQCKDDNVEPIPYSSNANSFILVVNLLLFNCPPTTLVRPIDWSVDYYTLM